MDVSQNNGQRQQPAYAGLNVYAVLYFFVVLTFLKVDMSIFTFYLVSSFLLFL